MPVPLDRSRFDGFVDFIDCLSFFVLVAVNVYQLINVVILVVVPLFQVASWRHVTVSYIVSF